MIGLDRDPTLLAAARDHAPVLGNLRWRHGDLCALDLDPATVDIVRTERVLIYVHALSDAIRAIAGVLRPGGTLASFELDYGATILAPGHLTPLALRRIADCLEQALPQPWAGRRIPALAARHGLTVTSAQPHSFAVDRTVWLRIVHDSLRSAATEGRLDEPDLDGWLTELADPAFPAFRAAFTGSLTTARR